MIAESKACGLVAETEICDCSAKEILYGICYRKRCPCTSGISCLMQLVAFVRWNSSSNQQVSESKVNE